MIVVEPQLKDAEQLVVATVLVPLNIGPVTVAVEVLAMAAVIATEQERTIGALIEMLLGAP